MRISDWSSDVCSSDLAQRPSEGVLPVYPLRLDQTKRGFWNESREARFQCDDRDRTRLSMAPDQAGECSSCGFLFPKSMCHALSASVTAPFPAGAASNPRALAGERSEEKTHELQSQM